MEPSLQHSLCEYAATLIRTLAILLMLLALPSAGLAALRGNLHHIHDDSGNLSNVNGGLAEKEWDEDLGVWSVTAGTGHITAFTYDGLNRKTSTTWDSGTSVAKTELLAYNAVALDHRTDAAGRVTSYGYDSLFRLTTTSYDGVGSAEDNIRYYKGGSSPTDSGPGPLQAVWYGDGTDLRDVTYELDHLGHTVAEVSAQARHEYVYDVAGSRVLARYHARPSGGSPGAELRSLVSRYDALNRLAKVYDCTATGIDPFNFDPGLVANEKTEYAYEIGGLVCSKLLPNGQLTLTEYDSLGRTRLMTTKDPGGATISQSTSEILLGPNANIY